MRSHHIAATIAVGLLVLPSCRTVRSCVSSESFTQAQWDAYYAAALKVYNDPAVWRELGSEQPIEFIRLPTLQPWGTRPGRAVMRGEEEAPANLVYVHIPVEDIGEKGQGVPHVHVVFEHPSKKVLALYVGHVAF